jgi:hypothetical protein
MKRAAWVVLLLAGCSPQESSADTTTTVVLQPLSTATVAGMPGPTTTIDLAMPAQSIPTTTSVPRLNRETQLAIRRCLQALGNDFLAYTLDTNAAGAVSLCNEAVVQLEVEPESEFVDVLLEQVQGALQAIGLTQLSRRVTEEDSAALAKSLDGYVARINVRLDEMPQLP